VVHLDVEQRRLKAGEAWPSTAELQTLQFLAALANTHKVTQINPGKTNRTDGAFQLFKDGKVGMVIGFSPLAAQLDAEGKVRYGVTQMPTNVGTPVTLGVEDYLMAFKKTGNREAVRRSRPTISPSRSRAGLPPRASCQN
jgi:multiple sugar transport system substrate-binding protein